MMSKDEITNPKYKERLELQYGVSISIRVKPYILDEELVEIRIRNPRTDFTRVRTISPYFSRSTNPEECLRDIILLCVEEVLNCDEFDTSIHANYPMGVL